VLEFSELPDSVGRVRAGPLIFSGAVRRSGQNGTERDGVLTGIDEALKLEACFFANLYVPRKSCRQW
jgi:hypothetical protein